MYLSWFLYFKMWPPNPMVSAIFGGKMLIFSLSPIKGFNFFRGSWVRGFEQFLIIVLLPRSACMASVGHTKNTDCSESSEVSAMEPPKLSSSVRWSFWGVYVPDSVFQNVSPKSHGQCYFRGTSPHFRKKRLEWLAVCKFLTTKYDCGLSVLVRADWKIMMTEKKIRAN